MQINYSLENILWELRHVVCVSIYMYVGKRCHKTKTEGYYCKDQWINISYDIQESGSNLINRLKKQSHYRKLICHDW